MTEIEELIKQAEDTLKRLPKAKPPEKSVYTWQELLDGKGRDYPHLHYGKL